MITKAQVREAEKGIPVEVRIDDTDFVLIRKDLYEREQKIAYDDSELSENELRAIAARTLDDLDSAGAIE